MIRPIPGSPPVPMAPARAPSRSARRVPLIDIADFGFMCLVFLIASDAFTFLGLHSALWLAAYGYALIRLALMFEAVARTAWRNRILLLYPGLCLLSVLWSDLPAETLRFSVQLLFSTLIAIFLGLRFELRQIFAALAGVLGLAILASVLNLGGALTPAYDHRGNFEGIFLSKNALGHRMVMFTVIGVFLVVLMARVPVRVRALGLLGLGATLLIIGISGSATAIVTSGVAALLGLALWVTLRVRGGWALVLAMVALPGAVLLFAVIGFEFRPVAGTLELLGRSPTLTGRTILWDFAAAHIPDRPVLGYGAAGFWDHPSIRHELALLQQRYGEGVHSFHNLWFELLIMLGPLGLVTHTLLVGTAARRSLVAARRDGDVYAAWALTMIAAMYAMALFGSQLYQQHAIPLMLVVAIAVSLDRSLHSPPGQAGPDRRRDRVDGTDPAPDRAGVNLPLTSLSKN